MIRWPESRGQQIHKQNGIKPFFVIHGAHRNAGIDKAAYLLTVTIITLRKNITLYFAYHVKYRQAPISFNLYTSSKNFSSKIFLGKFSTALHQLCYESNSLEIVVI